MSRIRERSRRALAKVSRREPDAFASVEDVAALRKRVRRLEGRVGRLEDEVQENRRLHRRLAELTDVVEELLVPIAQRDDQRLQEFLDAQSPAL